MTKPNHSRQFKYELKSSRQTRIMLYIKLFKSKLSFVGKFIIKGDGDEMLSCKKKNCIKSSKVKLKHKLLLFFF